MKALHNTVLPLVLLTLAGSLAACGDDGSYSYGYSNEPSYGPTYQGYYYAPAPSYGYSYGYYHGDNDNWHWHHHHHWWHDND